LLGSLAGLEPAELVVALGELTRHPLYRHEVAVEVAALLERSESEVKNLVFSALWRLRSPRAVPLLLEQLHSEDEDLRSRVHELLGALTGLRLPAQASSWKLALAL
jgi:HEAT repeat protein